MPPKRFVDSGKLEPTGKASTCNFAYSKVSDLLLQDFVDYGALPPKKDVLWRAPRDEQIPDPQPGEHVFFTAWLDRGFKPPGSRFLRELLDFFHLRPQDISPNSLLYVAMHTTLCEGYLGIKASILLFRYLFRCKEHREKKHGRFVQCGAVTFQRRRGVEFPFPHLLKKINAWQQTFFYCKCTAPAGQVDFLPFSESRFSVTEKFAKAKMPLTDSEMQIIEPLRVKLRVLMRRGLRSRNLVASWILLRVSPLSERKQLLCEYTGTSADPDRWGPDDTDLDSLKWWVGLCVADEIKSLDVGGLPPFRSGMVVPEDFWDPDCEAVANSDWNMALEVEENGNEADSSQVIGAEESEGEEAITRPRKANKRKRGTIVSQKGESLISISAKGTKRTADLEKTKKRRRLSRTSLKATPIKEQHNASDLDDFSSSHQDTSSDHEMNLTSPFGISSDSSKEDLPPIVEEDLYSRYPSSPAKNSAPQVLPQSSQQIAEESSETCHAPEVAQQSTMLQNTQQPLQQRTEEDSIVNDSPGFMCESGTPKNADLARCRMEQYNTAENTTTNAGAKEATSFISLEELVSDFKSDEAARKKSFNARLNQILKIKSKAEMEVLRLQTKVEEAINRSNGLERRLEECKASAEKEINELRALADEKIKDAKAAERSINLKQDEIDRLTKENEKLTVLHSALVNQINATAEVLFSDFAKESDSTAIRRSAGEQLISIKEFASFAKVHVSELLHSLLLESEWSKTVEKFKEQCANLKVFVNDWKLSSARAGASRALTLAKAHFPEINLEVIARGRPGKKSDGSIFPEEEYRKISKAVRSFSTRIVGFVNVDGYHRAYGMDGKPVGSASGGTPRSTGRATLESSTAAATEMTSTPETRLAIQGTELSTLTSPLMEHDKKSPAA